MVYTISLLSQYTFPVIILFEDFHFAVKYRLNLEFAIKKTVFYEKFEGHLYYEFQIQEKILHCRRQQDEETVDKLELIGCEEFAAIKFGI